MVKPLEHLAAAAVILFFVPMKLSVSGIDIYLADLLGIASLGFIGLIAARGQLLLSTIKAAGFVLLFVVYIVIAGIVSNVPATLVIIEVIQWLSITAFLGVLHQSGLLASPRFLSTVALYALAGAVYTAIWHFIVFPDLGNFKKLGNTKYLFGFSCLLLYLMRDHIRFSYVFLGLSIVLLVMSDERKAFLGIILMVACDYVFCRKSHDLRTQKTVNALGFTVLFGVILALLSAWSLLGISAILNHLEFTPLDVLYADQQQARWDSELWRKLLLANGFSLFLENPILGVGPKMLPEHIVDYFQNQELAIYTHNFALDVAIEYGLVGLTILFGGFLLSMHRLFSQRFQNPISFLMAVYILAMVLFVAINSTIMLMFLLPFFINTRVLNEPSAVPPSLNVRYLNQAASKTPLSNVAIHKDK
ncbi:O-antigen ligase family protein [Enterovibrio sp. ZSDZ42]|uniref:O-antigen ligase family protein n=1 Tax=Enterovibrio gelatinilyticus TaxID=2899819 RepID=A0ABT5QVP3_9GAMM|nr:O-antigen ligase family protein [Enterovibrio sp. ZSDZ42]MDD1792081.1 O-antigen ligase family protein [Enterovibrio sp. ZSDZ42]